MFFEGFEALVRAGSRKPLWPAGEPGTAVSIGRDQIGQLIPHREPFLFVDAITEVDPVGGRLRGERFIAQEDPAFTGHFPGQPVYPGVLLVETMGQFGLCLLHFSGNRTVTVAPDVRPRDLRATRIHHAAFLSQVGPGQHLEVTASVISEDEYRAICAGQILRDGVLCAFGIMEVYFVET